MVEVILGGLLFPADHSLFVRAGGCGFDATTSEIISAVVIVISSRPASRDYYL